MEIKFEKEYLRELYYKGSTSNRKYRFQPQIVKKYKRTIDILESVNSIEDLFRYNALCYEVLLGDKKGVSSVRVNDQYRIEFTVVQIVSETVVTICNIQELSTHYK
ncbi:MAG: type II toxin-antitoxin system RelE/ParE family toxin [Mediterranea sp.]|jgi:proteic killer suppression protein|nr:type II toxin-antitoxin system RelE/ParE family toxin [Mediterranea sp.]